MLPEPVNLYTLYPATATVDTLGDPVVEAAAA
jgi:hypothetical protein